MNKYKNYLLQLACSFVVIVFGFTLFYSANEVIATTIYLLHFLVIFGIVITYLTNKTRYFYLAAILSLLWKGFITTMIIISTKIHFLFAFVLIGWIIFEILTITKILKNKTITLL